MVPTGAPSQPKKGKTWLGLKKRTWYIVALGVSIIIIVAAVGGAVGGRRSRKSGSNTVNPPPNTTNGSAPSPSVSVLPADFGAVAASSSFVGKSFTKQLFYQDLSTIDIKYRMYTTSRAGYSPEQKVSLQIDPIRGSPIAAASVNDTSQNTLVYLFYITSKTNIALAILSCPEGSTTLNTTFNGIITTNLDPKGLVHSSTQLAAFNIGSRGLSWRVYYQSVNGEIAELAGDNVPTLGWTLQMIGPKATVGSRIAASVGSDINLHVFYSAVDSGDFFESRYTDRDGSWNCKSLSTPHFILRPLLPLYHPFPS